ncbi:MAG TPA: hypothetical protein VF177_09495 [Anaerolineae bacterium]
MAGTQTTLDRIGLQSGDTLSITEIFPDPHYQTRSTVLNLGQAAGFEPARYWGSPLAFTQNFMKRGN